MTYGRILSALATTAFFAMGLLLLSSTEASAQASSSRSETALRASVYGALGFAGGVSHNFGTDAAGVSPGFGARFEVPVHRHIVVGGQAQMLFWRVAQQPTDDHNLIDLDAIVRFRYPLAAAIPIELYVGLPLGLSFSTLNANTATTVGFNFSALAGIQVFVIEQLALVGEFGYAMHTMRHSWLLGSVDYLLQQAQANIGLALLF